MKGLCAVTAALALLALGIAARADVFNLGAGFTNLETVMVGDPGNAGDLSGQGSGGSGPDRICGSVGYIYSIGKYEVTAKQYTDFLNAKAKTDTHGLYNSKMWSDSYGCKIQQSGVSGDYSYSVADDRANRPVNYVSYWDACRFANWLGNGQGDGDTETGAYALNGYNGTDGLTIRRNAEAKWAVPSEDEWYKAAYYKGGGTDAGYWDYPTQSNTAPDYQVLSTDPGNSANYYNSIGSPYHRTNVGEYENSGSAYGTFDQGGNVWEWTEAILYPDVVKSRGLRGGSFSSPSFVLAASFRWDDFPLNEANYSGFRVSEVPEPASIIALAGGLISLLGIRRRQA